MKEREKEREGRKEGGREGSRGGGLRSGRTEIDVRQFVIGAIAPNFNTIAGKNSLVISRTGAGEFCCDVGGGGGAGRSRIFPPISHID